MPFCRGHATTMRRAQGSTLHQGCLWFDHSFPADPGYAYTGVSRFRRANDVMLMGKARSTDWILMAANEETMRFRRGDESEDTNSECGCED